MLRQRVRTRDVPWRLVGRLLVGLLALALVFYGAMVVLLAAKVDPDTVQQISGYRSAFDFLAGLQSGDVDGGVRALVAAGGLLALLVCGWLLWQEVPRPHFTRYDVTVGGDEHGSVVVAPRVVERLAAYAAQRGPDISGADARYAGDALVVGVTVRRPRECAPALRGAQDAVREALERHGLPVVPVTLTLTAIDTKHRRELN